MRIVFFGTAEFAVPSLEHLLTEGHDVLLCVTQPDRPQGRGRHPAPSAVKQVALKRGIHLSQPERLEPNLLNSLRPGVDVGVVAAYGQFIPPELLAVPVYGVLGVHPSLLPKYRGAAPVAWAIINGETTTGVAIFRVNEKMDAGDIISQRKIAIRPCETKDSLTKRLAQLGAEELGATLELLAQKHAVFSPQDESQASVAPKLTKAEGIIDWQKSAEAIERLVRATIPWPGATTTLQGRSLKVCESSVGASRKGDVSPGTVVDVTAQSLGIATGCGMLIVTSVQPSGRRRMSVKEFLAGHTIRVGEVLGGDAGNK